LFGQEWLKNQAKGFTSHPAYKRWLLCEDLLRRYDGLRLPEEESLLPELAQMVLDNQFLVACTHGQAGQFTLGDIANYGDEKVQKRIKSIIFNPSQFLDFITEISFAASHLWRGHQVVVYEEMGFPDFEIAIQGWDMPVAVDCKRIQQESSERRIGAVIKKVNRQVKKLEKPCYGLAVLDVTEKVENPGMFSNEIPAEVLRLEDITRHAVSLHNSSISAVILLWNEFSIIRTPQNQNFISLWLQRRCEIIRHKKPKYELFGEREEIVSEATLALGLKFQPRILLPDLLAGKFQA